jgi:hypothetical protein
MRYLLMIYTDEKVEASMSPEEQGAYMAAYNAFTKATNDRKAFQAGEALQSTATATTVRVRGGKTVTTDGPYAETKEQLGGYYLLNCKNLDEAIEFAAMIPGAKHGSIEVRPIMEFGEQS